MESVIETRSLCKHFGGKAVVDHLNLAVPKGAIFALLGENGAGKTTTIRMLTGLLPADHGSATILDQDCWAHAEALRRRVAYVPERPRYYDWMTIAELGWFTAGFRQRNFPEQFKVWTAKLQLDPKQRLSSLSKGQYAKVGLALALAAEPEVLILDEPTSGLDLLVRREFLTSMVGLAAEGRTILISSHQIAEVERVASHVAFLAKGRLLLAASMEELKSRIVRLDLHYEAEPPDATTLGTSTAKPGKHGRQFAGSPSRRLQFFAADGRNHEIRRRPHNSGRLLCPAGREAGDRDRASFGRNIANSAIWLAVTGLAIGTVEVSVVALGTGTTDGSSMIDRVSIGRGMLVAVASLGSFGRSLLAGEKDGTLPFLNNLTGRLGPIWRSKLAAGFARALVALAAYFVGRASAKEKCSSCRHSAWWRGGDCWEALCSTLTQR